MKDGASGMAGLELPFDQYQRYRLVSDVLAAVRAPGERLRVLDVGGRTALLRRFLPDDVVELVDVEASEVPRLVLGDGSRLPFASGAFDAVVTFDTLEHVPPGRRDDFVRECRRVARRWVVITGPYRSPEVERAERLLREFLATKLRERHRYLEEHSEHGLPERERVEALLRELGGRVTHVGHGNLERWLPLMGLALYLDRDAPLRGVARDFFRYYNRVLYASDSKPPVYRHAVIAAFADAPLPDPATLVSGAEPPAGAGAPIEHLFGELLAFDAQRDVVRAEWERLETVLEGHRETIAQLRADLSGLEQGREELRGELERERREGQAARDVLARDLESAAAELERLRADLRREAREGQAARDALQADLEGHREKLAGREAELADALEEARNLGAELQREQRDAAAALGALEVDLAGHREALAATRAEQALQLQSFEAQRAAFEAGLEALRGELAAHAAVNDELARELAAHRTAQGELEAELERMHGVAQSIQADLLRTLGELSAERELVAHLRAELRDRWKNLKRAFAWKKVVP